MRWDPLFYGSARSIGVASRENRLKISFYVEKVKGCKLKMGSQTCSI